MRLRHGYECPYCGAVVDILHNDRPQVVIHAASSKARTLYVNDCAIHTCEMRDALERQPQDAA